MVSPAQCSYHLMTLTPIFFHSHRGNFLSLWTQLFKTIGLLVNVLLKLQTLIRKMPIFFVEKMREAFAEQKIGLISTLNIYRPLFLTFLSHVLYFQYNFFSSHGYDNTGVCHGQENRHAGQGSCLRYSSLCCNYPWLRCSKHH